MYDMTINMCMDPGVAMIMHRYRHIHMTTFMDPGAAMIMHQYRHIRMTMFTALDAVTITHTMKLQTPVSLWKNTARSNVQ
mmetsp:Transcript_7810/g.12499  ORF Transcript_7810/g.12499 Transcript_7810/m.12499 type:complete len:80 (+) Transcript_7810:249-488(+)